MLDKNDRVILHCDCNSFFASVEIAENPSLRGYPIAVCGSQDDRRGIVLAKSEEAKKYGVKTAETIWSAKKKCPGLIIVGPHYDHYTEYSRRINEIYRRYTDLVEPFSIDESWLDVTASKNLFGDGATIAERIREEVKRETGVTISVGVSFNKIYAKLGSDYKKPDAITVISKNNYKQIIFPLPATDLMFVGKKSADILSNIGIKTIGDIANASPSLLFTKLGKIGEQIGICARGEDASPVRPWNQKRECKSIGNGLTFRRDIVGFDELRVGFEYLALEIGEKLRRENLRCHTVSINIKDANLHVISRQETLAAPTCTARDIADTALKLAYQCWNNTKPVRALTITAMNLVHESETCEQISLFDEKNEDKREKNVQLESALDKIRMKYGRDSVISGAIVNNDIGID